MGALKAAHGPRVFGLGAGEERRGGWWGGVPRGGACQGGRRVSARKGLAGGERGVGDGVSGSYGKEEFSVASNNVTAALGSYVTPGQQRFFRYRSTSANTDVVATDGKTVNVPLTTVLANTTVADGTRFRIMPQAYWYWRQFGLFGEWDLGLALQDGLVLGVEVDGDDVQVGERRVQGGKRDPDLGELGGRAQDDAHHEGAGGGCRDEKELELALSAGDVVGGEPGGRDEVGQVRDGVVQMWFVEPAVTQVDPALSLIHI